jgi:hypothetical protein
MMSMMFTHDDPILVLDEEQSWKLLERTRHGRIVLSAAGETDFFPVNFYVEIKPSLISGRHFNLGEQPERF